jgi:hypothetical protein
MKPFILSVDTEPDHGVWQGLSTNSPAFGSLEGLRRLGDTARPFDLRPTLLVTYSVAAHDAFEKLLEETGLAKRCEIGTHLHPCDTPPFGPWDKASRDNLMRVPDSVLEEKFSRLHEEVARRFGEPRSFRGGSWALDGRLIRLLRDRRYAVDSTVTPGISWLVNGRPSYTQAPHFAYYLDSEDPGKPGDSEILEIPVSIRAQKGLPPWLGAGKLESLASAPMSSGRTPLMALWRKLRPSAPVWLRPAFTSLQALREAMADLSGAGYLHAMCHGSEFWSESPPYASNAAECDAFFARLEGACRVAREKGYQPATLSEAAKILAPMARGK